MQLCIERNERLPALGWMAQFDHVARKLSIEHGPRVERGANWIVEGVWDGPFGETFDESPHFFGSGVRVGEQTVTFVPSCALVDRLVWAEHGSLITVSNSLALLLAKTGSRLISGGPYEASIYAVTDGVDRYDDEIPTSSRPVHQLYYHNLEVSSAGRTLRSKDHPRTIASFEEYEALVRSAIDRLKVNMSDERRRARVQPLATISRGYDSPTVCALARGAGLRCCYTSRRSNSLIPALFYRTATDDDGTVLAEALGLEARVLGGTLTNELYFLAGSEEPELVFDRLAADIEQSDGVAAVFTGYHGDMLWNVKAFADDRAAQIIRHDMSGLNLCELRLKAGFFNVALPFLFARSLATIGQISRSDAMKPWRTWTKYDRPIPRRLLTSSGVDGSLFGQRKKAVISRPDLPATGALRHEFLQHLQQETRISPAVVRATARLNALWNLVVAAAHRFRWKPGPVVQPADIRWRLYVWAVNRLAAQYAARFS